MVPFYTFYSMFGLQRTGDQVWAFGDARGRGFMMGATAGRTTLTGEGLQHTDGHSQVLASVIPSVLAYDPGFAYELAVIVREGIDRMYGERDEDVFYYITIYNENWPQAAQGRWRRGRDPARAVPAARGRTAGSRRVQLLASGPILQQALRAQQMLAEKFDVAADVWSATSFQQLRNDALDAERWNRLHPDAEQRVAYVRQCLAPTEGPIIAATDYLKAVPDMVARWIDRPYTVLGTDGFGRSDTREALRDPLRGQRGAHRVRRALRALPRRQVSTPDELTRAIGELGHRSRAQSTRSTPDAAGSAPGEQGRATGGAVGVLAGDHGPAAVASRRQEHGDGDAGRRPGAAAQVAARSATAREPATRSHRAIEPG